MSQADPDFDAIVVGSGMSGGWVAKELCERGLKVCVLERGRELEPSVDYKDMLEPWERRYLGMATPEEVARQPIQSKVYAYNGETNHYFVDDLDHPYETAPGTTYRWTRGYHTGGRSMMWARQSYRWSPMDFEANAKDGHGVDWPIRYDDLAPWYDHVERFAGIAGTKEGLEQLPDGEFLPAMGLNCAEERFKAGVEAAFPGRRVIPGRNANLSEPQPHHLALGRGKCQVRSRCERGCSLGAYFNSNVATLPAARRTGNLTLITHAAAHSVTRDLATGRATGVRVVDQQTKERRTYTARLVFLNASTINTALILLNSADEANPRGLANGSDQVGRNMMDHVEGAFAWGVMDGPGLDDTYVWGRRPNGFYIPRFRNVTENGDGYVRGYGYQGGAARIGWSGGREGVGEAFKAANRTPGAWYFWIKAFGEILPHPDNRVTIAKGRTDKWGLPIPRMDVRYGENERRLMRQASKDALAMAKAGGLTVTGTTEEGEMQLSDPGDAIHEMGAARMGRDPATSVLNAHCQAHEVPNLFISDGAAMTSSACQNPSLTYMALSARAANHAADLLQAGVV